MAKPKFIKVGDQDWLATTLMALKKGKVIVYPTDTAYGLGVDATNTKAVDKLLEMKARHGQPVHVVVSTKAMAERYVEFSSLAEKIFDEFLPGPLTLVLPLKKRVTKVIEKLSAGTETLGIRVPEEKTALRLSESLGRPITTPSANPGGGQTPYSIEQAESQFSQQDSQPDLYLDAGELPAVEPSTMISVFDDEIKVIREGPVSKQQILDKINIK